MKTSKTLIALMLILVFSAFNTKDQIQLQDEEVSNASLRSVDHNAFKPGEVLEYRLHYGVINAGTATLEIKKMDKKIAGREIHHIIGTGRSRGAFDWFFKVRDKYETYMDAEGAFPWMFVRDINEGGYTKYQKYNFIQNKNKVDNGQGKTFDTPEGVQDMLSAFYYARTIDFTNAKEGEIFTIWSFVDDEVWPLKIKFAGRETIKVSGEKYKALKFHPVIQEGRVFDNEEDLNVWVTDDANKVPLLAQAKVLVGSIKMELTGYKGLANPISIIE